MRLNKFIASSGICSRRKADQLISSGKVQVNDKIVKKLGTKINPAIDQIKVFDKKIEIEKIKYYYKVNKPVGYISTTKDIFADKKVTDLIDSKVKLFLVGRLDKNSQGLMILTNDGQLAYELTHPKFKHAKQYFIKISQDRFISRKFLNNLISKFKKGVVLEDKIARFDKIKTVKLDKNQAWLKISMHQGLKRQIRRMFERFGFHIDMLQRTQIAKLKLGDLKIGEYKKISEKDIF